MKNDLQFYDDALNFLECLAKVDDINSLQGYVAQYFDNEYDPSVIEEIIPKGGSTSVRRNMIIICGLIFLASGKHPQQIWGEEVIKEDNVATKYRSYKNEYCALTSNLPIHPRLKMLNEKNIAFVEHGIKGMLTEKLLSVSSITNANVAEFLTEGVIFKDKFFIAKTYDEIKWIEFIKNEKSKRENKEATASEVGDASKQWELHAVTMQGDTHVKCDDYSDVVKIDNDVWFCCSADGVGSSPNSHIGSKLASYAFAAKIREAYHRFGCTEKLMNYIQFSLAEDASKLWVRYLSTLIRAEGLKLSDYSTTFLFTFVCKKFIACGCVGDGNFAVEKKINTTDDMYGYIVLNDGFSGIVQNSVLSVAHLLKNPRLMRISFFAPSEVSGIIMCSDGANCLMYKNIDNVIFPQIESLADATKVMSELRNLNYEECSQHLTQMCKAYSSSNKYSGGRGDDCSMVYIKHRRT